jgi:large subunit ribosomal protein L6
MVENAQTQVEERVKVPEGVEFQVEEGVIRVKGPKGENAKRLSYPGIQIVRKGDEVVISTTTSRKRIRSFVGTYASHVRNLIRGVTEGFEYKMKVVHAHFPMTVKTVGQEILVENYLGEKTPRKTSIVGRCSVKIHLPEVIITGVDKEEVGQTASNLERLTRVHRRDPRVFQDGIYLIEKDGQKV